ncbi:MAG: ArsR/SmtB family transcription factor [Methanobacteriaceae archaeon]
MKTVKNNPNGGSKKCQKEYCCDINTILSKIPNENNIISQADVIKAISDPTRLKIIYLISYGELCVCEIYEALNKSQPTVSHHLNLLKKAGFLKWRKEGIWTYYKLSNTEIINQINNLLDLLD